MKKILFIEDDDVIRNNVEEILKLAQYEVKTACNGKVGSELAIQFKPDLIICDILMPELDGFGVIYVLSKNKETATIPFIFLSAKAQKTDIRKGMELGADDYLCKPFDDNELLTAIETRLNKYEKIKNNNNLAMQGLGIISTDDTLNPVDVFECIGDKHLTQYKKKEMIYHDNDIAQYIFIIKKGKVKSYKTHDDGKEFITQLYKDGDVFGYTAILSNSNYCDFTMTLEDSEIYKISKKDFINVISSNSKFVGTFIKMLTGEIRHHENQLLSLAYDSVRKRTAEALLLLLSTKESTDEAEMNISISRDDLASLAGTAVETVIRCLGEFKEDEIIITKGRNIVILDKQALHDI